VIYSDAPQLRQVILNFLTNATQAIGKDGVVTITTRLGKDDAVDIVISDTGAASRKTIWARSLTRFSPPNPRARGTGLGCPSAMGSFSGWEGGLRWKHGGPGHGVHHHASPQPGIGVVCPCLSPGILLVDDEERFRANLQKMLGAQGLTVSAVGSGAEALEELKLNPLM